MVDMAPLSSLPASQECYAVATGGIPVSQAVLKERYDYIFYTGNTQVGNMH